MVEQSRVLLQTSVVLIAIVSATVGGVCPNRTPSEILTELMDQSTNDVSVEFTTGDPNSYILDICNTDYTKSHSDTIRVSEYVPASPTNIRTITSETRLVPVPKLKRYLLYQCFDNRQCYNDVDVVLIKVEIWKCPKPDQLKGNPEIKIYYLPWEVNRATYMHLDHKLDQAVDWFVTRDLTGCDVWIADSVDLPKSTGPLIVHVNSQDTEDSPLKNLQDKQKLANEALDYFNVNKNNEYKFYCRISYDKIKSQWHNKIFNDTERTEIDNYWRDFSDSTSKIASVLYWPGAKELFYGSHNMYYESNFNGASKGSKEWKFRLKDFKKTNNKYKLSKQLLVCGWSKLLVFDICTSNAKHNEHRYCHQILYPSSS